MAIWLKDNLDFVGFVAFWLLLIAFGHFWLRKARGSGFPRVIWLAATAILAYGWLPIQWGGNHYQQNISRVAQAFARTYAFDLQNQGHSQISLSTRPDDAAYLRLIETEKRWLAANPLVHDIYTMGRNSDGAPVFLVDSETDYNGDGKIEGAVEARTPIGEVFRPDHPGLGLLKAFSGTENFDRNPLKDRWGTWVSAWAPIRNESGRINAVLGVDYDAKTFFAAARFGRLAMAGLVSVALITLLSFTVVVKLFRSDLAARDKAAQALSSSEHRFRTFMERSPVVASIQDPAGRYTYQNRAMDLHGGEKLDWIGKTDAELWPKEIAAKFEAADQKVREGRKMCETEVDLPGADGAVRTWWICKFPLTDDQGGTKIGSLALDVTDKHRREENERHSQKLEGVGQLAAGIAHDFNNLLTIIVGCAGVLHDPGIPRAEVIEFSERIMKASERAATLVRQLLAFSRRQVLFRKEVELYPLVDRLRGVLQRVLGEHIELKIEPSNEPARVNADETMIEQILVNIALNARDAMPLGGVFTLTTALVTLSEESVKNHADARAGDFVRITLRDTGFGMDPKTLSRLFEPFFTTKEVGQGSGMGLATVYGIVMQHEGWIEVRSSPGQGSAFYIFLPRLTSTPALAGAAAFTPEEKAATRRGTILLVEDDREVCLMVRKLLEHAGFRVREASSGANAIPVWEQFQSEISLLFTDMVMPDGVSGRELAVRFRQSRPDLNVIYTSGYSQELLDHDLLVHPNSRFLQKPFLPRELTSVVEDVLLNSTEANRPGASDDLMTA